MKADYHQHRPRGSGSPLKWQSPAKRVSGFRGSLLLAALFCCVFWRYYCRTSAFDLDQVLLSVPSAEHARNWSAYYTTSPHFVGQGFEQAKWTERKWKEFGISNTRISSYGAEIPMPIGLQRLALLQGSEVLYEAPLVDDPENKHAYREGGFMPAYFGFSANANITASYVFANFGRAEDFDALEQANVSLAGRIAVVKSANVAPYMLLHRLVVFRGEQIKNAEERGMAGVLVYTDPGSDQPINEANGYKPYPESPARPATAMVIETVGRPQFHACLSPMPTLPQF
jgi:N-acetylated-alpha-linked acidic dipeptidase